MVYGSVDHSGSRWEKSVAQSETGLGDLLWDRDQVADAEKAYAAENFAKAAQLLESASALHPGNLGIGCNLALTRYQ